MTRRESNPERANHEVENGFYVRIGDEARFDNHIDVAEQIVSCFRVFKARLQLLVFN